MKNLALAVAISMALPCGAYAAVQGKDVEYKAGDVTMKGYLAYDDAIEGKRPGVLVVHEWWGHNAYARKRADMLAELGYTALAVDMYGDGKTADHPKDAGAFSKAVFSDMDGAKARFSAALDTLTSDATVDAEKTAAIGYCFGGGMVLSMARLGFDIDGVASFHGSLATQSPAEKDVVKAQVFVANGEADKMVKPEDVEAFKKEMDAAGVTYEYHGYPDVLHSFTNPDADGLAEKFSMPLAYNEHADKDSWDKLQDFFKQIFK